MLLPVIWSLAISFSFVLFVVDCSDAVVCGDVVVVCEECSTLLEVPVVVSAIVVCFVVVEASQSIRKICEGSLLVSTILSLIKHT